MDYNLIIERCKSVAEFIKEGINEDIFLCIAVADSLYYTNNPAESKVAQLWISKYIGGHTTVESWLAKTDPHHSDYERAGRMWATVERSNLKRLEMIEELISYCKEQIKWSK